jgi:hypothetical protein
MSKEPREQDEAPNYALSDSPASRAAWLLAYGGCGSAFTGLALNIPSFLAKPGHQKAWGPLFLSMLGDWALLAAAGCLFWAFLLDRRDRKAR